MKVEETIENFETYHDQLSRKFDVDPTKFYVHSWDFMRIDVGLILGRAPIFATMTEEDWKYMVNRHFLMKEFFCDQA